MSNSNYATLARVASERLHPSPALAELTERCDRRLRISPARAARNPAAERERLRRIAVERIELRDQHRADEMERYADTAGMRPPIARLRRAVDDVRAKRNAGLISGLPRVTVDAADLAYALAMIERYAIGTLAITCAKESA